MELFSILSLVLEKDLSKINPLTEIAKEVGLDDRQVYVLGSLAFISRKQIRLMADWSIPRLEQWTEKYAERYLKASEKSVRKMITDREKLIGLLQNGDSDDSKKAKLLQEFLDEYETAFDDYEKHREKVVGDDNFHPKNIKNNGEGVGLF